MIFKTVFRQFKRRPVASLLAVCQFTLSLYFISLVVFNISGYFTVTRIYKNCCGENSFYVNNDANYSKYITDKQDEIYETYDEMYSELQSEFELGNITEEEFEAQRVEINKEESEKLAEFDFPELDVEKLPFVKNDLYFSDATKLQSDSKTKLAVMSRDFAEKINYNMKSGKKLSEMKNSEDSVMLAAFNGSAYKIGDTVKLYYSEVAYDENGFPYEKKSEAPDGIIVGIIDEQLAPSLNVSSSLNREDSDKFDIEELLDGKNEFPFITVTAEGEPLYENILYSESGYGHIVILKDDISPEKIEEFKTACNDNHLSYVSLYDSYLSKKNAEYRSFRNNVVLLAAAVLISMIGLLGITALSVTEDMRIYGIYYIFGMTKKKCVAANALYIAFTLGAAAVFSAVIKFCTSLNRYMQQKELVDEINAMVGADYMKISLWDYFYYSKSEIAVVGIVLLLAFVTSMIIPYLSLRKMQPVEILREK